MTIVEHDFAMMINALASAFKKELSPAMLMAYASATKDFSVPQLRYAIQYATKHLKFMPAPSELRQIAMDTHLAEARANLAWATVLEAVSRVGWYKSVDFEDKTINATIRLLGGWQYLCETLNNRNLHFIRKDFLSLYKDLLMRGVSNKLAQHLEGEFERQNTLLGFDRHENKPILIKDDFCEQYESLHNAGIEYNYTTIENKMNTP